VRQQLGSLGVRARILEPSLDQLEGDGVMSEAFTERQRPIEGRRVMGIDLEHAARVEQGVFGPLELCVQQLRELEANRNLVRPGEVGELGLQQPRQRVGIAALPVELAQRRLHRAIVGPLGQGLAIGIGGIARQLAAQEGVAQPHQPVGALLGIVTARGRGATQLDQIECVAGALVAIGQRRRDQRRRARVTEGDLEGGDGPLEIVELGFAHAGDLHAHGGALARGRRPLLGTRRLECGEPSFEHVQQRLGAVRHLVAFDQVLGSRHVRRAQLEDPLVLLLRLLVIADQLGVDAGQPPAQRQLPRVIRARFEFGFQCAREVVRAVVLLVALGQQAPHVRARRIDLDDAFEVGDLGRLVAQAVGA
jgi:hypothetical protein